MGICPAVLGETRGPHLLEGLCLTFSLRLLSVMCLIWAYTCKKIIIMDLSVNKYNFEDNGHYLSKNPWPMGSLINNVPWAL